MKGAGYVFRIVDVALYCDGRDYNAFLYKSDEI